MKPLSPQCCVNKFALSLLLVVDSCPPSPSLSDLLSLLLRAGLSLLLPAQPQQAVEEVLVVQQLTVVSILDLHSVPAGPLAGGSQWGHKAEGRRAEKKEREQKGWKGKMLG